MIYLTSETNVVFPLIHERFLKDQNLKSVLFIETAKEGVYAHETDFEWVNVNHDAFPNEGYETTRYTITGKPKEAGGRWA